MQHDDPQADGQSLYNVQPASDAPDAQMPVDASDYPPPAPSGEAPSTETTASGEPTPTDTGPQATGNSSGANTASAAVHIEIDIAEGTLLLRGGARDVLLNVHGERRYEDIVEERADILLVSRIPKDARLQVPDGSQVLIRNVYGDLQVEHFDGFVAAQHVGGDVALEDVAVTELAQVAGDLQAHRCGELRVRAVHGDVSLDGFVEPPLFGHISGDLHASDMPGIEVRGAIGGDVQLEQCGEVLLIGTIGGDLHAERSHVTLRSSTVGGDTHLTSVRGVTLAACGGDFVVDRVDGPVDVHSIGGDAQITDATGNVHISTVGGDVEIENAPSGVTLGRVGGDVLLETPLGAGAEYTVHASGDIKLRVRGDVNARFVAQTQGGEIRTRLPLTVERGRRRNLVGVVGRGDATVTLRSDGGDIQIAATDQIERESDMSDEFGGKSTTDTNAAGGDRTSETERSWEGSVGGQRFRVRWDREPGRATFHFKGPFTAENGTDAPAGAAGSTPDAHDFHFEWERGRSPRMYGEYEERLNDLRDKAERAARRAAEQAQEQAERTTRRLRETDWEAVGREVRTAVEKTMVELEDTFNQLRREWEARRPSTPSGASGGTTGASAGSSARPSGSQRVRIEYDDESATNPVGSAASASASSRDDIDAQRRAILEQLRSGTLSLDEAERQLNNLR